MNAQFTHPWWLLLLVPMVPWVIWLAFKSDVQISAWRRWTVLGIRLLILLALVFALAGFQWLKPKEGMNVYFLLDQSDSIPSQQQEAALSFVNQTSAEKEKSDKAGIIVFGSEASIESEVNPVVDKEKIQAVVDTERTDIASAIRLATAAFPEIGQKRIVLMTDGNENLGDSRSALLSALPLDVTLDVVPMGVRRAGDVSVQKLGMPGQLKKGQTFEVKIFAEAEEDRAGVVRLFRNDQFLGEQEVQLTKGKNLFAFVQTLDQPGFYNYEVQLDTGGDPIPQNNRARAFAHVQGDPRILIISDNPGADEDLAAALRASNFDVNLTGLSGYPETIAEMQSYDSIFLNNIAAGDLGEVLMKRLESAVRDFGVGLVCVGGDQSFGAGGYRATPLEATLPVDMELDSKKVLPNGALVIVCHATEFPNGNQWARDIAFAALDALGPQDEMGIVLWDGRERWLFPLQKVEDKKKLGKLITGMNPGDMVAFGGPMQMAHKALAESTANIKHMVVFSDGDPTAPSQALMDNIVADRITISSVMIGGHVTPETMVWMADQGGGRFYDVRSPSQLPQIFTKEAAVILKSAIFEQPFQPQKVMASEPLRGIAPGEFPILKGYVATTGKPRAEIPLLSDKGDPLLAHWQYGLGRAVAFTSDARPKWASEWLNWTKYQQFWSQVANWSLQRLDDAQFTTEVAVEGGTGHLRVEAVDSEGNYRNFLNLQTVVVGPDGTAETVRLEQSGPGQYETSFPMREVGAYLMNLMDIENGQLRGRQVLGASVNYSPEFSRSQPDMPLLTDLAEMGQGKVLSADQPETNPFQHDRRRTFQPLDLWPWLLQFAILLFPVDVGIRRIQLDREEVARAAAYVKRAVLFWQPPPKPKESEESLGALLARRELVRSQRQKIQKPVEHRQDLFQPQHSPVSQSKLSDAKERSTRSAAASKSSEAEPEKKKGETSEKEVTTNRLLDAKKRAQRWKK